MSKNDNLPAVQDHPLDDETLLAVVAGGDCARLTPDQKVMYYRARCEAAGLDPRAQPFAFLPLNNGKLILYTKKEGAEQLAAKHGIRVEILSQATEAGIRTVTVRAIAADGRQTDEIGCVSVCASQGDALCNLFMKAVTKAKRRAVLSICGLGMPDESELETIPGANGSPPGVRRSLPLRPVSEEGQQAAEPTRSNPPSPMATAAVPPLQPSHGARRIEAIVKPGLQEPPAAAEPDYKAEFCRFILDMAAGNREDARRLSVELTTEADPVSGNILSGWPSIASKRATPEAIKRAYFKAKEAWEKGGFGGPPADESEPAF